MRPSDRAAHKVTKTVHKTVLRGGGGGGGGYKTCRGW